MTTLTEPRRYVSFKVGPVGYTAAGPCVSMTVGPASPPTPERLPPFAKPGLCNAQLSRGDSDLCTKPARHREQHDPDWDIRQAARTEGT